MGENGRDGEDRVSGTLYYDIAYLPTSVTHSNETEPACVRMRGRGAMVGGGDQSEIRVTDIVRDTDHDFIT